MSEDGAGPGEFALRWPGTSPDPASAVSADVDASLEWADDTATSTDTDAHRECRGEIERLQSLVDELRGELRTLRRKAQIRSTRWTRERLAHGEAQVVALSPPG